MTEREGSLRQWANGNLQALLEPTPNGHRIRLRTVKGDARSLMIGGIGLIGIATVAAVASLARGFAWDAGMLVPLAMATMGAGMFGIGGLRLPGWARLRGRQMKEVAARVAVRASSQTAPAPHDGTTR